ncbi:hypothetical protein CMUS01_14976 [Colletotrichum musicola]|uniref:Uncharacterized protein n=1 Tax=Colletotrichum musicola TaxID=2175873 RepID=A0A8H6MPX7_9PEZI|nr:hypothetical protein CMUS01_14976 [Colletotrichum musicola]
MRCSPGWVLRQRGEWGEGVRLRLRTLRLHEIDTEGIQVGDAPPATVRDVTGGRWYYCGLGFQEKSLDDSEMPRDRDNGQPTMASSIGAATVPLGDESSSRNSILRSTRDWLHGSADPGPGHGGRSGRRNLQPSLVWCRVENDSLLLVGTPERILAPVFHRGRDGGKNVSGGPRRRTYALRPSNSRAASNTFLPHRRLRGMVECRRRTKTMDCSSRNMSKPLFSRRTRALRSSNGSSSGRSQCRRRSEQSGSPRQFLIPDGGNVSTRARARCMRRGR